MMNSSNIISDFFEPVDCFKNKIAADKQCQEQQECEHSLMILESLIQNQNQIETCFLTSSLSVNNLYLNYF